MRDGWIETTIGEVASWSSGKNISKDLRVLNGEFAIVGANGEIGRTNEFLYDQPLVVVGRVGSCGETYLIHEKVWISDNALIALPNTRIDITYLYYLLKTFDYNKIISGTTQPLITQGKLKIQSVLLPPLPEQKRIVDLISSVDSYIEALQRQLESAKRSRNAVLHELLTAGGDDWETTTIGDISDFVSIRKSPEQLSADSIYVGLEHLEPNNTSIDHFDSVSKVTSSLTPFDVGDVLFGRLRPYLHKVAIAEMFGFCSPEILVLRANSKVSPQMLLLFCDADSTIKICVERSAGTRMPRTSTEDLASIEINLPSIVEQIKLAELSSTFDTVISHIGIALEKSKILRSGLLSDLLSGTHEIPASYDKAMGTA